MGTQWHAKNCKIKKTLSKTNNTNNWKNSLFPFLLLLFRLIIALSVLLRFKSSDCPFDIFLAVKITIGFGPSHSSLHHSLLDNEYINSSKTASSNKTLLPLTLASRTVTKYVIYFDWSWRRCRLPVLYYWWLVVLLKLVELLAVRFFILLNQYLMM